MKIGLKATLAAVGILFAGQAAAQLTLFKDDGFQGNRITANHAIDNFANSGFNDEISSVDVRGGAWEVCTDAYFEGRCVVLRPGDYPSLRSMGINDQISSVRPIDQYGRAEDRYYDPRGRYTERAYGDQNYYGPRDGGQYYYGPQNRDYDGHYRGQ
jgi:hypothetical protein